MARFAADYSDSSSSDEEERAPDVELPPKVPSGTTKPAEGSESESESDDDSASSSSSDMKDDDLISSPPRNQKTIRPRGKNALVEDENGDVQYAHEVELRVSRGSSSSHSPPVKTRFNGGDPTIIPWAQRIGVDAQTMHVMQTSLFRVPEEAAALKAMNEDAHASSNRLGVNTRNQLNRKHSRDSDGDGLKHDLRERGSFEQDLEPHIFRPTRKYARVSIASSIANGNEGSYVDAGLAMGRSFRVGWGPGGQLVHLGSICSPNASSHASANSSTITLTKTLPSLSKSQHENSGPSAPTLTPPDLAAKLLQHHLSHTTISPDESGIPLAIPTSPTSVASTSTRSRTHAPAKSPDPLNFSSFMSLFPSTETSTPAPIFRLGSALFDPIDLHLGRTNQNSSITGTTITPDIKNRVNMLRRKTALSKWLEDLVKPSVDGDLRMQSNGSGATYTAADAAFTHLTGHQIAQACTSAADGGYIKLSTLISQAGGDELFKEDILSQVEIWKNDKLAPGSNSNLPNAHNGLVGRDVWRLYSLLGGLIHQEDPDNRASVDVCSGLDWKRVFGLYLWYGTKVDSSISDVVKAYESALLRNSPGPSTEVARPVPKWITTQSGQGKAFPRLGLFTGTSHTQETDAEDPLYALIKIYADPALSLSKALNPLSFAPSGLDWGVAMCWHLYIILSRVMRVRDFVDRSEPVVRQNKRKPRGSLVNGFGGSSRGGNSDDGLIDDDDDNVPPEGHSPSANLLTSSYAFELESWGMIQEAVFVLMHLEDSAGRKKAIKDLLARSSSKLDDWMTRGLVGSLKLPMSWVDEAKAMHELDSGRYFSAYELYISAGLYNAAHTVALYELAPDAIIRKDLELLRTLFSRFDAEGRRDKIDGWFVKGKIFLDYVEIVTKLPKLLDDVSADNEERPSVLDATQESQIDDYTKRAPKIIAMLPDILHRSRSSDVRHVAALEEMSKDLLRLVERARPLLLSRIQTSTLNVFDGSTKIKLARGIGYARFLQSIEA